MKTPGKLTVITGGASGIGREMVKVFTASNYDVVFGDIDEKGGAQVAKEHDAMFVHTNVCAPKNCEYLMDVAVNKGVQRLIYVLIANVGHNDGKSTADISVKEWGMSIRLNLDSIFYTCKAGLPKMAECGRIILVSSLVGIVGQENNSAYVAAKAGIIGYAKALALEVAERGITVNVICPHAVETPLIYEWAKTQPKGKKKTLKKLLSSLPLDQFIDPLDVAHAALFLASPYARGITGTTLLMDGGASLGC